MCVLLHHFAETAHKNIPFQRQDKYYFTKREESAAAGSKVF
jgi:hypothetical protein